METSDLKILIVTNMWPDESRPYFGIFVKKFADCLKERVSRLEVIRPAQSSKSLLSTLRKYAGLRKELARCREPFDIVQVEYAFPTDIATWFLKNRKLASKIVAFHGSDVYLWKRIPFGKAIYGKIVRDSEALVFPSRHAADFFKSNFKVEKPVYAIPRGIDPSFLEKGSREESRRALGLSGYEVVVLSVASFVQVKNHAALIRALEGLETKKRVAVVLVGDGPERTRIEGMAGDLKKENVDFIFTGAVRNEEVKAYYDSADVFVTCSLSEGYGVSVQEAMAKGLCVLASDIPAHRESIEPLKTGLLFDPQKPEELAELLKAVIEDDSLRRFFGEQAAKSDKIWTMERTVDEYLKVYRLVT